MDGVAGAGVTLDVGLDAMRVVTTEERWCVEHHVLNRVTRLTALHSQLFTPSLIHAHVHHGRMVSAFVRCTVSYKRVPSLNPPKIYHSTTAPGFELARVCSMVSVGRCRVSSHVVQRYVVGQRV
jgi:hypothetical protein